MNYVEGNNFGPYWGSFQDELHPMGDQLTDELTNNGFQESCSPKIEEENIVLSSEDFVVVDILKFSQCDFISEDETKVQENFSENLDKNGKQSLHVGSE